MSYTRTPVYTTLILSETPRFVNTLKVTFMLLTGFVEFLHSSNGSRDNLSAIFPYSPPFSARNFSNLRFYTLQGVVYRLYVPVELLRDFLIALAVQIAESTSRSSDESICPILSSISPTSS